MGSVLVDELLDGNSHKEPLDSLLGHLLSGSATECDGLEDSLCAHTIDNASGLTPGLHGEACDKPPAQASSGAVWCGCPSKRHLQFFK
jgi:hypothetical protein